MIRTLQEGTTLVLNLKYTGEVPVYLYLSGYH